MKALTLKEFNEFLTPEAHEHFQDWTPILGEGVDKPDVVLVKPSPSFHDAKVGKPFMGKDGVQLRDLLLNKGISFYATNAVPMYKDRTTKVKKEDADLIAPAVAEELRRIPCNRFMLFGVNAARWLPTFEVPFRTFNEIDRRMFEVGENKFLILPATMGIVFSPSLMKDFVELAHDFVHGSLGVETATPDIQQYFPVNKRTKALPILRRLQRSERLCVDVESTGKDPFVDRILTMNVTDAEGYGWAFPWELFSPQEWADFLSGPVVVCQGGEFDIKILANHGVFLTLGEDTLLMHSLVDETPGKHALEQMSAKYLGMEKWGFTVNYDRMEEIDFDTVGRYGARDVDLTLRLANHFRPQVERREIHKVLHRAQNALIRTELKGMRVDREKAYQFDDEISKALHDRKEYMGDMFGLANPNSYPQVADLLYNKMGLPVQRKAGSVTTAEEYILPFADEHPVINDILEYRHLVKAQGTYIKNILLKSERDGRYHPRFKLANTETGRVAESLLLTLPRADELENPDLGKQYQIRLRELFIPDEGFVMIGADQSALEPRMIAHLSADQQLITDLNMGIDIHAVNAIRAFELPIPLEPYETLKSRTNSTHSYERTQAKFATFTYFYGGEEQAIISQLGVSYDIAHAILVALRTRYLGVASYQDSIRKALSTEQRLTTPWGRTRRFFFAPGMSERAKRDQEREAINFPIQAHSADMTLESFSQAALAGLDVLFPFHDAVYIQAPEDKAEEHMAKLTKIMENIIPSPVKWEAEAHTGMNLGEL